MTHYVVEYDDGSTGTVQSADDFRIGDTIKTKVPIKFIPNESISVEKATQQQYHKQGTIVEAY